MFKWIVSLIVSVLIITPSSATYSPTTDNIVDNIVIHKVIAASEIVSPKELREMLDKQEVYCLAQNLYFEARGEDELTQRAVAAVTLNRVKNSNYPKTVCQVVYARSASGKYCAFSWVCEKEQYTIYDKKSFDSVQKIAYNLYHRFKSGKYYDSTTGALFFHDESVEPYWKEDLTYVAQIGELHFYKE